MTSVGWTTRKIDKAYLQKFTNKVAAAIHKENSALLVSTGSVSSIRAGGMTRPSSPQAVNPPERLTFSRRTTTPITKRTTYLPFINSASGARLHVWFRQRQTDDHWGISGERLVGQHLHHQHGCKNSALDSPVLSQSFRQRPVLAALAWQYIGDKTDASFGGYTYTIDPALAAMDSLVDD